MKTDNIRKYISHEREAEFRVLYKTAYKEGGFATLYQILGELAACIYVLTDVIQELVKEKDTGDGNE
jgi:hypothetical protein